MELRHLRYFMAVAEELSFKRAADRLHIAQPPLSVQIRQLETEIGTLLFSRAGHKTQLTEAGRVFMTHARSTLLQASQGVRDAQLAAKGEIGHLSIGYGTAAEFRVFPAVVPAFKRLWPHVHLSFRQMGTMQQIDALRRDELDVAFVWAPISTKEFEVRELLRERFSVFLYQNHRLARARRASVKDLSNEPLVLPHREADPEFFRELEQLFLQAGAVMNVAYQLDSFVSMLNFVSMETGCCILPDYIRELSRSGVVFKELRPPNFVRTVAIVKKRGARELTESFFRFVISQLPRFADRRQHA